MVIVAFPWVHPAETRAFTAIEKSNLRNLAAGLDYGLGATGFFPPGKAYSGSGEILENALSGLNPPLHEKNYDALTIRSRARRFSWRISMVVLLVLTINLFRVDRQDLQAVLLLGFAGLLSSAAIALWQFILPLAAAAVYGMYWAVENKWYRRRKLSRSHWQKALFLPFLFVCYLMLLLGQATYLKLNLEGVGPGYYQYATDGVAVYILQSSGPDGDYDLQLDKAIAILKESSATAKREFSYDTYDSSNGTTSSGDILYWKW